MSPRPHDEWAELVAATYAKVEGAIGAFATLGHWLLIRAHHFAPAPVLSPFI